MRHSHPEKSPRRLRTPPRKPKRLRKPPRKKLPRKTPPRRMPQSLLKTIQLTPPRMVHLHLLRKKRRRRKPTLTLRPLNNQVISAREAL